MPVIHITMGDKTADDAGVIISNQNIKTPIKIPPAKKNAAKPTATSVIKTN